MSANSGRRSSARADWPAYMAARSGEVKDERLRAFLAACKLAPGTPVRDAPLVALDMETTGLDPRRHSIVSIGLVPFELSRIRFSARRHWVLKPRFPLEDLSVTLHHITHADLEGAPDLNEVLGEVLGALAGRLPVVHYRAIERSFFASALTFRLGESITFPMIDTMAIEARFYRQSFAARVRRWLGKEQVSLRLQDCRARYGLPYYQPHQAVIDALATAELFQAQLQSRLRPDTPIGELWC